MAHPSDVVRKIYGSGIPSTRSTASPAFSALPNNF
jgi:hypothetical protein